MTESGPTSSTIPIPVDGPRVPGVMFVLTETVRTQDPARRLLAIAYPLAPLVQFLPTLAVSVHRVNVIFGSEGRVLISFLPFIGSLILLAVLRPGRHARCQPVRQPLVALGLRIDLIARTCLSKQCTINDEASRLGKLCLVNNK
jgi:hypothetical protein